MALPALIKSDATASQNVSSFAYQSNDSQNSQDQSVTTVAQQSLESLRENLARKVESFEVKSELSFAKQVNILNFIIKGIIEDVESGKDIKETTFQLILQNAKQLTSIMNNKLYEKTTDSLTAVNELKKNISDLGQETQKASPAVKASWKKFSKKLKLLNKANKTTSKDLEKWTKKQKQGQSSSSSSFGKFKETRPNCVRWTLEEVCQARHSHATIDGFLSGEKKKGNKSSEKKKGDKSSEKKKGSKPKGLSLLDFVAKLKSTESSKGKKTGWNTGCPALQIYRMPDGKYTSWDNRRLWALKKVQEDYEKDETPEEKRSLRGRCIHVQLWEQGHTAPRRDVKHILDLMEAQPETTSADVNNFRVALIGDDKKDDKKYPPRVALIGDDKKYPPLYKDNKLSCIRRMFMRIYIDAGSSVGSSLAVKMSEFKNHRNVVVGYNGVKIRVRSGSVPRSLSYRSDPSDRKEEEKEQEANHVMSSF